MDLLEKINRSFGTWYEGLFGGGDDVRPRDILRLIISAMEDNRKQGFDNRVYVPNLYLLEIAADDEEEKEYLLAFLDRTELEAAIRRYCKQNNYQVKGELEFTVKEVNDPDIAAKKGEKVRVRCRYSARITEPDRRPQIAPPAPTPLTDPGEDHTVQAIDGGDDEEGTVPSLPASVLVVHPADRSPYRYAIARPTVTIGRSLKSGNDLVIDTDTQMSRQHARIERGRDGGYWLVDMKTTNGTFLNGARVEREGLAHGDEIRLGTTKFVFESKSAVPDVPPIRRVAPRADGMPAMSPDTPSGPRARRLQMRSARLVRMEDGRDKDDFLLGSETIIGRGVTNDIVLADKSVATRHAKINCNGSAYYLESLRSDAGPTTLNGMQVLPGTPALLKPNDRILIGAVLLRFEAGD